MARREKKIVCPEALYFQPDAVLTNLRKPPRIVRLAMYTVMLCIVSATVWACLAEVDKVARARGVVATTSNPLVIQPLETGVIRELMVAPGDVVRKGEVLAVLDATFSENDVAELADRVSFLKDERERLNIELADTDSGVVPLLGTVSPKSARQAVLFHERRAEFEANVEARNNEIKRLEGLCSASRKEQGRLSEELEMVREIEMMRKELYDRKVDSRLSYLMAKRERHELGGRLEDAREKERELSRELDKARSELKAYINGWESQVAREKIEADQELSEARHKLAKAARRHELVRLTAPADGIVQWVARYSAGSVVREAERLMTIIPLDSGLEADVEVPAKDIGLIRTGQAVRMKLDAFPFQRHGAVDGTVRMISPDGSLEGGEASTEADGLNGGSVVYKTRVALGPLHLRGIPSDFRLIPGMTLTAEIKLGKRTVMSYLTDPVVRALDESLREN